MADPILLPESAHPPVIQIPKQWYKSAQLWWTLGATTFNILDTMNSNGVFAIVPPPYGIAIQGAVTFLLRLYRPNQPIIGTPPARQLVPAQQGTKIGG